MKLEDFLQQFEGILLDSLNEATSDTNLQQDAQDIADSIKARTRGGEGVAQPGGNPEALAPLSSGYIKQRQTFQKYGQLSAETTPDTSNLTNTGAMLDDIVAEAKDKQISILIGSEENRAKAREVSTDRPFFNASSDDIKSTVEKIQVRLIEALKRTFGK
jgi:hypothetical protein